MNMQISTTCSKCGTSFRLDLGELTKEEAKKNFQRMEDIGGHCPGGHVELGGLSSMWNLQDVLHRAYELGQVEEPIAVPTDREYVEVLWAEGKEVLDGGSNSVPSLNLPSIHQVKGLQHLGFGEFTTETHTYHRCDSPRGTRFYIRVSN